MGKEIETARENPVGRQKLEGRSAYKQRGKRMTK